MKKILYVAAAMVAMSFAACGGNSSNAATDAEDSVSVETPECVCTEPCDSCKGDCGSCESDSCSKAECHKHHEGCEGCPKHAAE